MARRVFGEARTMSRKKWIPGALVACVAATALFVISGASALAPSTFEGNDGNLVAGGGTDWSTPAPNLAAANDAPTGTGDNAFGEGTSENDVNVTVVTGSIPNSKADLGRFAVAGETVAGKSFLYLAWARNNDSGTTNFDFEINKAVQPNLSTAGSKLLDRSTGDLLINYGFQGNSLTAVLSLRTWTGSAWSAESALGTCAQGAGNATTISENLGGLTAVSRTPGRFGEAVIDLSCAGIVPEGSCNSFSSAYVKSRSSTAFTSAVKDFIAPVQISLSNCGALKVTKHSIKPNTPLSGATFSVTKGGTAITGSPFTTGTDGSFCVSGIAPGTDYVVTETGAPTGYAIDDTTGHTVTVAGGSTCATVTAQYAATDTPLTDIWVEAKSQVTGGTASSIECVDAADADIGNSPQPATGYIENPKVTALGVEPGTYVCTIVVDP